MFFFNNKYDLTFICKRNNNHFAEPILAELEKKYKIQYLFVEHSSDYWHFRVKGRVVWNEWANKFAWHISKKNWGDRKVFVRLHRYEIDTKYMNLINWNNIDKVVFVNSIFETEFKNNINQSVKTITIPNAININSFPNNKVNYGNNLCTLSVDFNERKGYIKLINLFNKLIKIDNSFRLNIIAQKSDLSDIQKVELDSEIIKLNLNDFVTITQRYQLDDINKERNVISNLLQNNDIIISYSDDESFHYSFAEGMLSGLEGFYNMWQNPKIKEFWEDWGYNSEDDFINGIISWSKLSNEEKINKAQINRNYVVNNFGSEVIAKQYEELFFGNCN